MVAARDLAPFVAVAKVEALEEVSALLVQHFPLADGEADSNELPDAPFLG